MDEDTLRQLLSAQNGIELVPTPEMMMSSAISNDNDALDAELSNIIQSSLVQQQDRAVRTNPPAVRSTATNDDDDDDLLLEDETILERIIALKEMFPESLRNIVGKLNQTIVSTAQFAYSKGRIATWWTTSTMCVLVFPILIQKELLQVAEQISREQRSILLGPQAATGPISGSAF